jgi:phosphohistidine phosphatase
MLLVLREIFMEIFLLRHAEAVEAGKQRMHTLQDDRPLSSKGKHQMKESAGVIGQALPGPVSLLSSPLLRAVQTAKIVAKALDKRGKVVISNYLLPHVPPQRLWTAVLSTLEEEAILLVGHDPQLSKLVAFLTGTQSSSVDFKKGALCCIELEDRELPRTGKIKWFLTPKLMRRLALPPVLP